MDFKKESIQLHKEKGGKLEISSRVPVRNKQQLSLAYSPGVAGPSLEIHKHPAKYRDLTSAGKTIAIISDGSAVLGLGNIGAKASMPVMEGKAVLMKQFAGLNSIPIVLDTQNTDEIVETIVNIAASFAGINLEDFAAPQCFEIEKRLKERLDIPVMHDDQHGTAVVVLAGLINALKVTTRQKNQVKIVVNGTGAAGVAIIKLLDLYGFDAIVACDSQGVISKQRKNLSPIKQEILHITQSKEGGSLQDAIKGMDVFIGVSKANLLKKNDVKNMNRDPIIFALANPVPEINPEKASKWGAAIIATGRSDYPNQINNVLAFPGIFRGTIDGGVKNITDDMKIAAAEALAKLVSRPTKRKIVPGVFEKGVADTVANEVKKSSKKQK